MLVACPPTSPHASNSPPPSFQVQGSNLAAFTHFPPNGFPVLPNFFVANPVTPKLPLHYHQHQWNLLNNTICHSLLIQITIIFAQTKIATHNYIQHRKGKWLAANQRLIDTFVAIVQCSMFLQSSKDFFWRTWWNLGRGRESTSCPIMWRSVCLSSKIIQ